MLNFKEFITESKMSYQVYHNTYSSAVSAAIDYANSRGYEIHEDDIFKEISTGPRKPVDGETNKFSLKLKKMGKEQRKMLHIQIYGKGDRYELNLYIN